MDPPAWQYVRDRRAQIEGLEAKVRELEAAPTPWNLRLAESLRLQADMAQLRAATYSLERM